MNWKYIFSIIGLYITTLSIAWGQNFSQLSKNQGFTLPEKAKYEEGFLLIRIKDTFREDCFLDEIKIPDLTQRFQLLQVSSIEKVFPFLSVPNSKAKSSTQELVDLSLIYLIPYQADVDIEEAVNLVQSHEAIEYVEPWYTHDLFYQPNDFFADTSGTHKSLYLETIKALEAWDIERTGDSVVIGIVDTGISFDHPDLKGNVFRNLNDPIDGVDNDNDGYVDNFRGWDMGGATFYGPGDNDPTYLGHGVGVTGVACAETDNSIGIAGSGFNAKYLAVKASSDDLISSVAFGYQGIVYAVEHGAHIVNCSWGGSVNSRFGKDVVRYAAINKSAAVIAAAGNSSQDEKFYPAAYPEAISVAGTFVSGVICCENPAGGNSTYNYSVDIAAPGSGIWTTTGANQYGNLSGTSYAAPMTAGAVAITMSHFPQYTPFQAAQRVRVTATDIYGINLPAFNDKIGNGLLNMYDALVAPGRPSIRIIDHKLSDNQGDKEYRGGDTLLLSVDLINYLDPSSELNVSLSLPSSQQSFVEVYKGEMDIGTMNTNEVLSSGEHFWLVLKPNVPLDFKIDAKFTYTDPTSGYVDFEYVENIYVNRSWINVDRNNFHTTINSLGNFGFNDFQANRQGLGVQYSENNNSLFEGGFMVAKSSGQVFDRIRNDMGLLDNDFRMITPVAEKTESQKADFEAVNEFEDGQSSNPMGVSITQETFAYTSPEEDDFVIIQYLVHNDNNVALNDIYAGLFADWDIAIHYIAANGNYSTENACNYEEAKKMVFAYDLAGIDPNYYGISLLKGADFKAFATTVTGGWTFSDQNKWAALTNTPTLATASAGISTGGEDIVQFISTGPINLPANTTDTIAFALLAGPSFSDLGLNQIAAANIYTCILEGKGPVSPFTVSDSVIANGNAITVSDNNSQATTWSWDFGDGTMASTATSQHTYTTPGTYTVSLTVSDGNCEFTSSQTVTITPGVGLADELLNAGIQYYPNPVVDQLLIELNNDWKGNVKAVLIDRIGREINAFSWVKNAQSFSSQISTRDLTKGVYILQISMGDRTYPIKIMKN